MKEIEKGSANVYADLDVPDAGEMLVKAQLAAKIAEIIKHRRMTQVQAAELLGMPQPDSMGVVCLSEHGDDILMWSHYSDGHQGFCLEFDRERLEAWKFCQPVDYDQKYLSFKDFS